jgi:hypothetical protein
MGNIKRLAYAETGSGACPAVIYVKLLLTALVISGVYLTSRTHKTKAA